MLQLKKGLNLESLRQPLKTALVTAARLGAEGVEINARTQLHPATMSRTAVRHFLKTLADLNLCVAAIHFPTRRSFGQTDELERRIEATKAAMSMAYELGCNVVVNGLGPVPEEGTDQRQTMVEALTDIGMHGQKCGAWLAAKTGDNDGATLLALMEQLPIHSLKVDFDPAELLIHKNSVNETMKALAEHVAHFRARDAVQDVSAGRNSEVQLGRGSIDWSTLLGLLEEKGYGGYLTVQRDAEADAVVQCGESLEYLSNLFA